VTSLVDLFISIERVNLNMQNLQEIIIQEPEEIIYHTLMNDYFINNGEHYDRTIIFLKTTHQKVIYLMKFIIS
jgi:hypothetical protein